jgi:hypothetical protein
MERKENKREELERNKRDDVAERDESVLCTGCWSSCVCVHFG